MFACLKYFLEISIAVSTLSLPLVLSVVLFGDSSVVSPGLGVGLPGVVPPGVFPPGVFPPGVVPPGVFPPGVVPPGVVPFNAFLASVNAFVAALTSS